MDIGCSCVVSDRFFKNKEFTGYLDIYGNKIYVSDKVKLRGCTSEVALIGKTDNGFKLFFGSTNGSVQWHLNNNTIISHKIQVIS